MRRITLSSDIKDPPFPSVKLADYQSTEHFVAVIEAHKHAKEHARTERARHDAWHATFNAAIASGSRLVEGAYQCATTVHGPVKWFGTDENVV